MKTIGGIVVGFLIVALAGGLVVATGTFNTAATAPAGRFEQTLAEYVLDRSVKKRAPEGQNRFPSSPEVLGEGLAHFRANCLPCHGAPQVEAFEFGKGLNPPAPDLAEAKTQARPDGELFWITSHGIRMTGMPAFSPTHGEEEIWKVIAFVRHLPELTDEERSLLQRGVEEQEHRHGEEQEAEDHPHPPGMPSHPH